MTAGILFALINLCVYFLISYFSSPIEHVNPKNVIDLLRREYSASYSETPINSTEREMAKMMAKQIRNREKFFVRLCQDVFLELLSFGNRRRLTKLERFGRRFHLSIGNFFGAMPFLRVNLQLSFGYLFFLHKIAKINNCIVKSITNVKNIILQLTEILD